MKHPFALDPPAPPGETSDPLVGRLANLLSGVDLDCACRAKLDDALARFANLERIRERRQLLSDARQQVARINALLDFLKEVDDLGLNEADRTVFDEVAQLFEDVASAARQGAADARRLG
jgi:hypothetical protein